MRIWLWCVVTAPMLTGLASAGCLARYAPQAHTKGSHIYFGGASAGATETKPEEIEVYYKREPDRPFDEIGIVEAMAKGRNVSLQDLFPELTRQASQMNANAIYKIDLQRHDYSGESLSATAVAIRFHSQN